MTEARDDSVRKERTTDIIARLDELAPIDDTLERPTTDEGDTEEGAPASAPQTKLSDVAAVAGSYARERGEGLGSYLRSHRLQLAIVAVLLLVATYALVMAGIRAGNLPSEEEVRISARERVETPAYSGGFYGYDDPIALASVEVGNRRHLSGAPEGTDHGVSFGAASYAEADVTLSYRNQYVSAVKTATIGFAERQEHWVAAGVPMNEQVAYAALTGVSEEKALSNINLLLDRADTSDDPNERTLQEIYADATLEVKTHSFNPVDQTDMLVVHCICEEGVATYECVLTAYFSFVPANGLWELSSASVTEGAKTRSLTLLEGSWEGSFQSQRVSEGNNCLSGSAYPMQLTIDGFGEVDGETVLDAHVTLLAHFHEPPETSTDVSDGDKKFVDEAITCTLVSEMSSKLVFEGSLPDHAGGTVDVRLEVDGSERITATVTTTHDYTVTTLLIFTEDKSVTYTDTYALRRTE